ncbi:hypothetical protein VNO78_32855 [Psophocarpus tetragonolobus]|uniref:Uncharacterized protein n=1 Tax=Psophocarpus tetragonolobus TaxID=3891 RepID=A0AAN9P035_PSOTE
MRNITSCISLFQIYRNSKVQIFCAMDYCITFICNNGENIILFFSFYYYYYFLGKMRAIRFIEILHI